MPYDQFVRWQLAGDEFEPENPLALKATGFLGAGVFPTQITANEVERTRYDALDDMAATTGSAMLGLSVGCARCHDHKFDPIPQADYYRFVSTFTTTVRSNLDVESGAGAVQNRQGGVSTRSISRWWTRLKKFENEQLPGRLGRVGEDRRRSRRCAVAVDRARSDESEIERRRDARRGRTMARFWSAARIRTTDWFTFNANTDMPSITGHSHRSAGPIRRCPKAAPAAAANGNFAADRFQVAAQPRRAAAKHAPSS